MHNVKGRETSIKPQLARWQVSILHEDSASFNTWLIRSPDLYFKNTKKYYLPDVSFILYYTNIYVSSVCCKRVANFLKVDCFGLSNFQKFLTAFLRLFIKWWAILYNTQNQDV